VRLFAVLWEAPDQVGWRFGFTQYTEAAAADVLERFAFLADIAAEEGSGDPLAGARIRRHGRVVDLGTADAPPAGFPGIDLDRP
jgi:hypothetical protein